jgi:AP-1-like transcription factor
MATMTSNIYPSPTNSTRETASPQPTIKVEERSDLADEASRATKPPTKRKRENRYKNAPPSVLSVRFCDFAGLLRFSN